MNVMQALSDLPSVGSNELWIPNYNGVLCCAADLIFNDAPWLEAQGLNLVHPKLSYEVSCFSLFTPWLLGQNQTLRQIAGVFGAAR